ncbi:MAG TPA: DNA topoisomerase I [Methanocorpusculum sp.]|nr:DNA topoisomerase I [Methanocorpusculum sp.]
MHLIIAEKNIVAERIAAFLAGKEKVQVTRDGVAAHYTFDDTVVMGLRGHVVEVDFVEGYNNWRSPEHPPRSLINAGITKKPTEKKIVGVMQKLARKATRVTIATDYDTEGELIGKEAYELIRAVNIKVPVDRARFSAITKEEIIKSIQEATKLDFNLAAAGESRQIIDLVWGASLTRFLSITARRGADSILSVGRVQSPTLAMIVDREREIEAFVSTKYWVLSFATIKDDVELEARHAHGRFTDEAEAKSAYDATKNPVKVTEVITGQKIDRSPTPLDTTALIVGASRLGISASYAMNRAEDLYMRGFISYPRTDNTTYPKSLKISEHLDIFAHGCFAKEVAYVKDRMRSVPTRGKKETTDHPPIYPTSLANREEIGDDVSWKLYEFIVRRFFATLCIDAEWETMKVNMLAGTEPYTITGGRILEAGWRGIYPYSKAEENILPQFTTGETLTLVSKNSEEKDTQPPARYSQSRLIQRMEELGLGTKSTRHEVISKLAGRKYIEGNPMKPTIVGRAVTESLEEFAGTITEPTMTKTLEEHMGDIASGTKSMDAVLSESRKMLSGIFVELEKNEAAIGRDLMDRTREEQLIGPCPVCGKPLIIKRKLSSQFIGCSGYPDCTFNAGLPPATWGNAIKMDEVCQIHHVNHVQLLRKGAPPWKIGCPLCSHIKSNTDTFLLLPGMTEEGIRKLNSVHIYTISELISRGSEGLSKNLGLSKSSSEKLIQEAEGVLAILKKRTELKKFISGHIAPKRGRGHSKVSAALISLGVTDVETLSRFDPTDLLEAKLSEAEAFSLVAEAKNLVNISRMKEYGVPAITLKKYANAGFDDPEKFIAVHPAGLSLATGVSVTTICNHQKLVAEKLCRPCPEKISKAAFETGIAPLRKKADDELLTPLALAGVYSPDLLVKADIKTLAKVTGIEEKKISDLQKYAKKAAEK